MGVRLRVAGGHIRPRFQPDPSECDEVVEHRGVRVFVSREIIEGLDGDLVIDVTAEHEQLTVRGR